jgi:pectate lyase
VVGIRFNGVSVPPGAAILEAHIQFQVDETGSGATSLILEGEAVDTAAPFLAATGDISARPSTAAYVAWSPVPWLTVGEAGPDQQTPDLSPILQEIVDRPGWSSGNALVVILTGTGKRVAEAFDGDVNGAPLLRVRYLVGGNAAPNATITAPPDGSIPVHGDPVTLTGTATDAEDGDLSASLAWVSDRDGALGTGASVTRSDLSVGLHTITASVTDSGGLAGSDQMALTVTSPPAAPLAFHGAEGFGANAVGGRGGAVIEVTNLNDDGPGSFRAALDASGPRLVVFRVGGTIELDSSIEIRNPYITIAGQTAPGQGITLKNSPRNAKTPLKIETHDAIVRYIRSRPGSNPNETGTLDAITIANEFGDVYNVIVDHSSFSWATDEVSNVYYAAHDITVQWSILGEGLDCATHIELGVRQCHSMGMLLGSEGARDISIHHNLFAHNRHRNPRIKTMGTTDVVNNVVYNSGSGNGWRAPTYVHGARGVVPVNYIANFFKPGPDSGSADWFIDTSEVVQVYAIGNIVPKEVIDPDSRDMLVGARHPAAPVTTTIAFAAYFRVLAEAGASRGLNCDGTHYVTRDPVDDRIVNDVKQGTGRIIDDPSEVGGWPNLVGGIPCADSDHDGMPDEFETLYGFDPTNASDGSADSDGDGYTNVEEFLNSTAPVR